MKDCKLWGVKILRRLLRQGLALLIGMAFSAGFSAGFCAAQTGVDATLPRAVILSYGRVGDESGMAASNISTENFEAHLAELRSGEFTILPVGEIIAALRAGRVLPDKTVGILLEDLHNSVYTTAWPRLRDARLPATLFMISDTVDRGGIDTLTWSEIREMSNEGLELGNQTASYPHMLGMDRSYLLGQVVRAADRIQEETGQRPGLFLYPYGEHDALIRKIVAAEGYQGAFGQQSGVAHARLDPFALPRFSMNDPFAPVERLRLAVQALPLLVSDVTPGEMLLESNVPAIGFTIDPIMGRNSVLNLACFVSSVGRAMVTELDDYRIEVRLHDPLPIGRSRLNCTLPTNDGRWRWFGMLLVVP